MPTFATLSAHQNEWTIGSAVDPAIVTLNLESLVDTVVQGTDVIYPIHERLGWHLVRFGKTTRPEIRGWWVSGIDPLDGCKPMVWGRFKPDTDTPVIDREKHEAAKYLSPKGQPSRATFLRVPYRIGLLVARNAGLEAEYLERMGDRNPESEDFFFWQWVIENPLVVVYQTEGEKKAGALLTQGYAAIALPGINSGARTKDREGNRCKPYLIPELQAFCTPGRVFATCFDYETKTKVVRAIAREINKLTWLFRAAGCEHKVVHLPGPEKGVDDFIVAQGSAALHEAIAAAKSQEDWEIGQYSSLTYPATLTLNQKYLGELPIPESAKLVAIKSPKGTGKTESFVPLVKAANDVGRRVLVISHRVQLGQAICDRVGVPFVTELRTAEEGAMMGYGLCIDSLHPESQARFNPAYWGDAIVIIDEAEQVLWHLLNASTEIKNRRVDVLWELKELLLTVLESDKGQVILSDADLTDLSIKFVQELSGIRVKPWVCVNEWQPAEPWTINHYNDNQPDRWFTSLNEEVARGGRVFVVTHSQKAKSRWSTVTMEGVLQTMHPTKRILRIDSQSISDPTNPAYGCISHLNDVLPNYDIVLCSPSIETGVSIDIRGHFSSVWGCIQGVTTANSARQSLARVREAVPRHLWLAKRGLGSIGNGASSARSLTAAQKKMGQANLWSLELEKSLLNMDQEVAGCSLLALGYWAKIACRINRDMRRYRNAVIEGLIAEGHKVEAAIAPVDTDLITVVEEVRDTQHEIQRCAIADAEEISASEYEKLKSQKTKTQDEWHKERKHALKQRYCQDVTPDLVGKDDDGWYPKLRLYYFLMMGREFMKSRDKQAFDAEFKRGEAWLPTMNKNMISVRVALLEMLGVPDLLIPDKDYRGSDPLLQKMKAIAQNNAWEIKAVLNVTIPKDTPDHEIPAIQIAQILLGTLGLKLRCDRREGPRGDRQRVYKFVPPTDGRDEVCLAWWHRDDQQRREQAAVSNPAIYTNTVDAWTQEGAA